MIPPRSVKSRYKSSGAESLQQAEKIRAPEFPAPASSESLHALCSALGAAPERSGKEVTTGRMWKFRIAVSEERSVTQEYRSLKPVRRTPKARHFHQRKGAKGGSVVTTDSPYLCNETQLESHALIHEL